MNLSSFKCEPEEELFALSDEEINSFLKNIFGWSVLDDFLIKSFPFDSLNKALAFSNRVALLAQQENQYPKIVLSSNSAEFHLQTKSIGVLTKNDFVFASKIDELFKNI